MAVKSTRQAQALDGRSDGGGRGSPKHQRSKNGLGKQLRVEEIIGLESVKGKDRARERSVERASSNDSRRFGDVQDDGEDVEEVLVDAEVNNPWSEVEDVDDDRNSPKAVDVPSVKSGPKAVPSGERDGTSNVTPEMSSPKAPLNGEWANGSPSQHNVTKGFQRVVPAFVDPNNPTQKEIVNFDKSRFFFELHKSDNKNVDNVFTRVTYINLKSLDSIVHLTPRVWKRVDGVFMIYVTCGKNLSELDAKTAMSIIAAQIMLPNNSPLLIRGVDTAGQITTSSRIGIDCVFYFAGEPDLDGFTDAIKKIIRNNSLLTKIFDCITPREVRSQLQLTNCLGITATDLLSGTASFSLSRSNFHFKTPWHIAEKSASRDEVITSNDCFLTITYLDGAIIPESFQAPTMSGDVPKTVQVKRVFEYTNRREHPASLATKSYPLQLHVASSENVRFKTRLCKHGASECPYGVRCLFAHGANELRPKPDSVPAAKNTMVDSPLKPTKLDAVAKIMGFF